MQSAINTYPPENITGIYAITALVLLLFGVLFYFSIKYLLKYLAHRVQQQLKSVVKPNLATIISAALKEIEIIKSGLQSGSHHPKNASEEISKIARKTFDILMNHRTLYQSRNEVSVRHLDSIAQLQAIAYPLEFSSDYSIDQALRLCDKASEVVQSCH